MNSAPRLASSIPFPLGVAAADGSVGFVFEPIGRSAAVDLATGAIKWCSEPEVYPLIALDGRLCAAQATAKGTGLNILLYDEDGQILQCSNPMDLPDWVEVDSWHDTNLELEAAFDGTALIVHWRANADYAGGAPPPDQVLAAARREASGTVEIDLVTGAVDVASVPPELPEPAPPLFKGSHAVYLRANSWSDRPWRSGEQTAALIIRRRGRRSMLDLRTWRGGEAAVDRWLPWPGSADQPPHVSLDGRFVLIRQGASRSSTDSGKGKLEVVSIETGETVSVLAVERETHAFCILGPSMFYLVDADAALLLVARSLRTGKMLWRTSLALPEPVGPPRPRW